MSNPNPITILLITTCCGKGFKEASKLVKACTGKGIPTKLEKARHRDCKSLMARYNFIAMERRPLIFFQDLLFVAKTVDDPIFLDKIVSQVKIVNEVIETKQDFLSKIEVKDVKVEGDVK